MGYEDRKSQLGRLKAYQRRSVSWGSRPPVSRTLFGHSFINNPATSLVNIKLLKIFARERLPKHSTLRELILAESGDEIDAHEFVGKAGTWDLLCSMEVAECSVGSEETDMFSTQRRGG